MLGFDEGALAAIFTVQTAGEALDYHPHLNGLPADGYWKDNIFTRFSELDLRAIEQVFAEGVLAELHKLGLLTDDNVVQILSQDPTDFGVWMGDSVHDKESQQFVARYIERSLSRLRRSLSATTSSHIHRRTEQIMSLMRWGFLRRSQRIFRQPSISRQVLCAVLL